MTTASPATGEIHLALTAEEKSALLELLAQSFGETRVEMHRTHTPQFRERVLNHENLIRAVIKKLQAATA